MLNLDPMAVVNTPALRPEENTGMLTPDYSGLTWQDLEKQRLAGETFSVAPSFVESDLQQRQQFADEQGFQFGVGEDVVGYDKDYIGSDVANQREMSAQGQLGAATDEGTAQRLSNLGLQADYKQNMYKGYRYNPNTGEYDYYDNTPSMIDQALPVLIKTGITAVAGNALGAIVGGFTGLNPDTINSIKKTIDIVDAVKEGNVLDAVSSSLSLSGMGSPAETIQGFIEDSLTYTSNLGTVGNAVADWAFNNSDVLSESILKFTDKMLQGEGFEGSLQSAALEYIKEGGGFSDLIPEGSGFDIDTPEFVEQIGDIIAEGASEFNRNVIRPVLDSAEEVAGTMADTVRETGRDIREFVDPAVETVRETGRDAREAVDPIVETVRETGRDVREAVDPVVETVRETGRDIRNAMPDVDPDIDLPSFSLGSSGGGGYNAGQYASLGNDLLQPSPSKGPVDYKDLTGDLLRKLVI